MQCRQPRPVNRWRPSRSQPARSTSCVHIVRQNRHRARRRAPLGAGLVFRHRAPSPAPVCRVATQARWRERQAAIRSGDRASGRSDAPGQLRRRQRRRHPSNRRQTEKHQEAHTLAPCLPVTGTCQRRQAAWMHFGRQHADHADRITRSVSRRDTILAACRDGIVSRSWWTRSTRSRAGARRRPIPKSVAPTLPIAPRSRRGGGQPSLPDGTHLREPRVRLAMKPVCNLTPNACEGCTTNADCLDFSDQHRCKILRFESGCISGLGNRAITVLDDTTTSPITCRTSASRHQRPRRS
jgi:hypothetical protein